MSRSLRQGETRGDSRASELARAIRGAFLSGIARGPARCFDVSRSHARLAQLARVPVSLDVGYNCTVYNHLPRQKPKSVDFPGENCVRLTNTRKRRARVRARDLLDRIVDFYRDFSSGDRYEIFLPIYLSFSF